MAYVMCPKHGGQATSATCPHAHAVILDGGKLGHLFPLLLHFEGQPLGPLWFCPACADRYGIPQAVLCLEGEGSIDRMYELDWVPICHRCFVEAGGAADVAT